MTHADERYFARNLVDLGTWLPIVSGTWPAIQSSMTPVLTMHLDKGNYGVTAEIVAANYLGTGYVVCLFGNGTLGYAGGQSAVGLAAGFAIQQTYSFQDIFTIDAPVDISLSCFNAPDASNPVGNPRIGYATVIATKIDTVTVTQQQ